MRNFSISSVTISFSRSVLPHGVNWYVFMCVCAYKCCVYIHTYVLDAPIEISIEDTGLIIEYFTEVQHYVNGFHIIFLPYVRTHVLAYPELIKIRKVPENITI